MTFKKIKKEEKKRKKEKKQKKEREENKKKTKEDLHLHFHLGYRWVNPSKTHRLTQP
jgi:hypothetical protein